jgi:hypothetical protein
MKNRMLLLTAGSALVLSACGGGGGGSGTSTPAPTPTSTLSPITAANATSAAGNAYAATTSIGASSSSLTDILTGVSISGANISTVSPVLNLVKRAYVPSAPQLLTGVTYSESCTGGGTVTIDANLRNNQTISNGDTMTLTAKNCVEDGETLNGAMSITFSEVSGDIVNSTGAATMDTRFNGFSVTSGSDTAGMNGDMKIAISVTGPTSYSLTISGKSLQATEQKSGANVASFTLADYSVTASANGTTISSAANFMLSGSSNSLGQFAYSVKNIQPFVSVGTAMPGAGALIVNGAGSSVTLTAVNSSSVKVDFSAKGDGTITQTNTLSWAQFLASI